MELKRLELIGFKSFADKTRFDFDRGITALVGPNGCGKSNVVDAIKWILGEQSVKSLRSSEMADVIFSGTESRKALGFAEASLTFTDVRGGLKIDADEATITRRVYRNGEGEYLINHEPCRLRDIREMFMDTGIGVNAYSIVEQGRVSYLLQANSMDRRVIFEEAAGISKFKARKKAAVSRMKKTEQHLLRLQDIIEEVTKRLRTVRIQAGRARRFTEYSEELKQLRVSVFQKEYLEEKAHKVEADAALARVNARHEDMDVELAAMQTQRGQLQDDAARHERDLEAAYATRSSLETDLRLTEQSVAQARRRIEELEDERAKYEENLREHLSRIRREAETLERLGEELSAARAEAGEGTRGLAEMERRRASVAEELMAAENRLREDAAIIEDLFRRESGMRNDLASVRANLANAEAGMSRMTQRIEKFRARADELDAQTEGVRGEIAGLRERLEEHRERIAQLAEHEREKESDIARLRDEVAALRQRAAGCRSRRETIEDLHSKREGVSKAVREVLARHESGDPEFAGVEGLLGDLIPVTGDHAHLIEAAAGHNAEAVVVSTFDAALSVLDFVRSRGSGRVTCVVREACDSTNARAAEKVSSLLDLFGNGAANDAVFRHLFGPFSIVDDIAAAADAARRAPEDSFVTRRGDVLTDRAHLSGGVGGAGGSIISRRAELVSLARRIEELAAEEHTLVERSGLAESERASIENERLDRMKAAESVRGRHADLSAELRALEEERRSISDSIEADRGDLADLRSTADEAKKLLASRGAELAALEARRAGLEQKRADEGEVRDALRRRIEHVSQTMANARAEIAQLREKADQLERRAQLQKESLVERRGLMERARQEIDESYTRQRALQAQVRENEAQISAICARREELEGAVGELETRRGELRNSVLDIEKGLGAKRALLRELEEERERARLDQQRYELQLDTLVERIRDDYQMDLAQIAETFEVDARMDWDEARRRMDELRRKVEAIGAVNMEALGELEELEERSARLEHQRADVEKARADLEEVIRRIEVISEERFRKTFKVVRSNFQDFFRRLFGGGRADIVLEDDTRVLECGIEIIARPPGKEPKSIMLLSGGEKALTTIALLFAILRSKPSPFVVLDEVDAPLDDTNIERFVNMVRDFLVHSQFLIITHSKRTMSMSNCLYGVTMEEKGVSKRVVVKLEDYDGPVEATAPAAQADEDLDEFDIDTVDAPIDEEQIYAEAANADDDMMI